MNAPFSHRRFPSLAAAPVLALALAAGLAPAARYKAEVLKAAVKAAKDSKAPIELLVKKGATYRTVVLDYHGGLRYPRLERIAGSKDRLETILQALK